MNHLQVLHEIEARGLSVAAAGRDLRLTGPRGLIDAELVGQIRAVKADLLAHLAEAARDHGFALTPLQRGYFLGRGDIFEMGNVASQVYHEIEGVWDVDRLESALRSVVARHGQLRTRFTAAGTQVEQKSVDGPYIERLDLRGESEPAQRQRREALRHERSHRMLPTDRAPLIAVEVTILADDRMVLHVTHDGLVTDGISMFRFFREWCDAYNGSASGPDTAQVSFEAYVEALEHARAKAPYQRSRAHWLARLDDLAPHPDLPLRTSPHAITQPRFTSRRVGLEPAAWQRLQELSAQAGLTLSGVLLAAYAETLARWGAGSRFTINSTVANRPPIHPHIFDAIGNFTDTMLIEIALDRGARFVDRAHAVQTQLRRDLDNRHFSGVDVLRELSRRRGGAEVRMPFTFNSSIGYLRGGVDGSALELFGPEVYTVAQTPQVWLNVFAMEQHGALVLQIDSVDELFPQGLLDAVCDGYQSMLTGLLDQAAWAATTFDLLPAAQKFRRQESNDTAAPEPTGLLADAFLARAAATPNATAIITVRSQLSYRELHRQASQAAAWLRARNVRRDELVGLVMTRGPEQVVGILATILAGGAYLPVDATLPPERQRYLLRDGQVRCVLTNTELSYVDSVDVLALDATRAPDGEPVDVPALAGATPDDLAYVLYTSGTTGDPKGVMVTRRAVANVVADCNARFAIDARDRFFAISAFTFDLSVYDVFGALSAGAAIVLPDHDRAVDPQHWLELCAQAGVSVWNSVPSIVSLLHDHAVAEGADQLATLRLVMMSGDRIPPRLPAQLRSLRADDLCVVSLGGPTETTIWNILHPIGPGDGDGESIPYGRPNTNNRAYVLDADLLDTPDWVTGEIWAAGVGLARGYWGDAALTAHRFVHDAVRDERLYRTGDLGCYRPDGTIEIRGRSDFQIKVNGYRIEAGEVETRLVGLAWVSQAVVVRSDGSHGARLVAHVAPSGPDRPGTVEVRQALRASLPEYMIPAEVLWHDSLPVTGNGKVDRALLTQLADTVAAPAARRADTAASAMERELAGLWESVLRVESVDPDTRLYDLGGDSIAAARIIVGARKLFGVSIPFHQLPEADTVRAMAAWIAAAQHHETVSVL